MTKPKQQRSTKQASKTTTKTTAKTTAKPTNSSARPGIESWRAAYARRVDADGVEHVVLAQVQRGRGMGKRIWAEDAPQYVRDYCNCVMDPSGKQDWLWRTEFATLDDLRACVAPTPNPLPDAAIPPTQDYLLPGGDANGVDVQLAIPSPRAVTLPPKRRGKNAVRSLADLYAHFDPSHDTVASLNRRIYKDTRCGASISIYGTVDGLPAEIHNPGREIVVRRTGSLEPAERIALPDGTLPDRFVPTAFTLQTIVEGSDVEVNGDTLYFGRCTTNDVDRQLASLEEQVSFYFERDNMSTYRVTRVGDEDMEEFCTTDDGDLRWDVTPSPDLPLRTAFEAWYAETDSDDLEDGETVEWPEAAAGAPADAPRLSITRLDRSMDTY